MATYLMLDDSVIQTIKDKAREHNNCSHLAAAMRLLTRIDDRPNIYKALVIKEIDPEDLRYSFGEV